MKTIILGVFFIVSLCVNASSYLKIDYIRPQSYEYHFDINTFYDIWESRFFDTFTRTVNSDEQINEIKNYLSLKEPTDQTDTWPIAIIYINKEGIYEVGLMNMKKVGTSKIYKTPFELWILLNKLLNNDPIYEAWEKTIKERNIIGDGECHYLY